jgi:hypothetical protein
MFRKLFPSLILGSALAIGAFGAEVVVRVAPPAVVVEHPGPARHGEVWIAGYHRWDGRRYVWVPGHYEVPPREHSRWVAHRWVHRNDGWVLEEGHWR